MRRSLQSNFAFGVADESYMSQDDAPQYMQASAIIDNMHITATGALQARKGTSFAGIIPEVYINQSYDTFEYLVETSLGYKYQLLFYMDLAVRSYVLVSRYQVNDQKALVVNESIILQTPITNVFPNEISVTSTGAHIIICSEKFKPQHLVISTPLSGTKFEEYVFSVIPSMDFGKLDYSKFQFTPQKTEGRPFGYHIVVANGSVPARYVGGAIYGQGLSKDEPLGYGIITEISNDGQILHVSVIRGFSEDVAVHQTEGIWTQLGATSPEGTAWVLKEPIWSDTNGWPIAAGYYKGRLWLGGCNEYPSLMAGSVLNQVNNFNVGTGDPTDAICYMLNSDGGGRILNIHGAYGLQIFTEEKQFVISAGAMGVIAPGNFDEQMISDYRISNVPPIYYRNKLYFTCKDGKTLIQFDEDDQSASFTDLSFSAGHLLHHPICLAAASIENNSMKLLYILNQDGTLVVFAQCDITGVQGFSRYNMFLKKTEKIISIVSVENVLALQIFDSYKQELSFYYMNDAVHLDRNKKYYFVDGIVAVDPIYHNDTVNVVEKINDSFMNYGEYLVKNGQINLADNPSYLGKPTNFYGYVGKIQPWIWQSVPLKVGKQSSLVKKLIVSAVIQYYKSHAFTFRVITMDRGKREILYTQDMGCNSFEDMIDYPKLTTGYDELQLALSLYKDIRFELEGSSAYPMLLQSVGWTGEQRG